jgi:hypothetical protein
MTEDSLSAMPKPAKNLKCSGKKEVSVEQQYSPIIGLAPYFENCSGRIEGER